MSKFERSTPSGRKLQSGPNQKLDRKTARGVMLRLGGYVLRHWPLFLLAIVLTLVSNQLSLLGPKFSGDAIDAISAAGGVKFNLVWPNVIKMAVCYGLSAVTSYLLAVTMIHLSQKVVYTMRRQLFEKLTSLPVGYFDTHATGDIISRISYDIDTVNASLSQDIVQVMTSIYTVLGSLIFMWNISKPLILIFAVTVPASILFTRYRSKRVRPLFSKRSYKLGELNGYAEEMLSGGKTIRAYCREDEIGLGVRQEKHGNHGCVLQRRVLRRNSRSLGKLYKQHVHIACDDFRRHTVHVLAERRFQGRLDVFHNSGRCRTVCAVFKKVCRTYKRICQHY